MASEPSEKPGDTQPYDLDAFEGSPDVASVDDYIDTTPANPRPTAGPQGLSALLNDILGSGGGSMMIERVHPFNSRGFIQEIVIDHPDCFSLDDFSKECGGGKYRFKGLKKFSHGRKLFSGGSVTVDIAGPPLGNVVRGKGSSRKQIFVEANTAGGMNPTDTERPDDMGGMNSFASMMTMMMQENLKRGDQSAQLMGTIVQALLENKNQAPQVQPAQPVNVGGMNLFEQMKEYEKLRRMMTPSAAEADNEDDGEDDDSPGEKMALGLLGKFVENMGGTEPQANEAAGESASGDEGEDEEIEEVEYQEPTPEMVEAMFARLSSDDQRKLITRAMSKL